VWLLLSFFTLIVLGCSIVYLFFRYTGYTIEGLLEALFPPKRDAEYFNLLYRHGKIGVNAFFNTPPESIQTQAHKITHELGIKHLRVLVAGVGQFCESDLSFTDEY